MKPTLAAGQHFLGERVPVSVRSWAPAWLFHQASHSRIRGRDYASQESSVPKIKRALVILQELSWLHWWSQIQILFKKLTYFTLFTGLL